MAGGLSARSNKGARLLSSPPPGGAEKPVLRLRQHRAPPHPLGGLFAGEGREARPQFEPRSSRPATVSARRGGRYSSRALPDLFREEGCSPLAMERRRLVESLGGGGFLSRNNSQSASHGGMSQHPAKPVVGLNLHRPARLLSARLHHGFNS